MMPPSAISDRALSCEMMVTHQGPGIVAVCMIKVPMGIDHVSNITAAELSDRGFILSANSGS